jgi:Putative  PD-(D/E)XK family member, (DUF4420)
MNDFESQWRDLSTSGHSGGRLRVYPDHILDFFINYSLSGNRELMIEAKGVTHEFSDLPSFENLELIVKPILNGVCIGLTLTDNDLVNSFSVMCYDIAERSKRGETTEAAAVIAIESLRDWAALLKRRGQKGLSRNEVMGLWGELSTLDALLVSRPSNPYQIIQGWGGPNGDQRDIGFNGYRIEIKTQLSTRSIGLRITSLDQLDDRGDHLKVILNRISPSDKGASLADLIASITQRLIPSRSAQSEFELKIELAGYDSDLEVCKEQFALDERINFTVSDDFPRLTPGNVPQGIKSVEYEISGAAITQFQITWDELVENLSEQP